MKHHAAPQVSSFTLGRIQPALLLLLLWIPGEAIAKKDAKRTPRSSTPIVVWHAHERVFALIQPDIEAQGALWKAPTEDTSYEPLAYPDEWIATLPNTSIGRFKVKDWLDFADRQGRCRIERFVVLARGVPHFGAYTNPDTGKISTMKGPRCGAKQLFAELKCPDDVGALMIPQNQQVHVRMVRDEDSVSAQVKKASFDLLRASPLYKDALKTADETASKSKKRRTIRYKTNHFKDPSDNTSYLRVEARISVKVVPEAKDDARNPVNFNTRIFAWWRVSPNDAKVSALINATVASKTEDFEAVFLFGPQNRLCFVQTEEPELGLPYAALVCQTSEASSQTLSQVAQDFCDCGL